MPTSWGSAAASDEDGGVADADDDVGGDLRSVADEETEGQPAEVETVGEPAAGRGESERAAVPTGEPDLGPDDGDAEGGRGGAESGDHGGAGIRSVDCDGRGHRRAVQPHAGPGALVGERAAGLAREVIGGPAA